MLIYMNLHMDCAAVRQCGSAAVRQCAWLCAAVRQCAVVCGSKHGSVRGMRAVRAAVCCSAIGIVRQGGSACVAVWQWVAVRCENQCARQCAVVCGSARGSVWQCTW
jgi:hypothetical protein